MIGLIFGETDFPKYIYKKIKNKNEFDAIIIYGSFYLVGEFLESNLV